MSAIEHVALSRGFLLSLRHEVTINILWGLSVSRISRNFCIFLFNTDFIPGKSKSQLLNLPLLSNTPFFLGPEMLFYWLLVYDLSAYLWLHLRERFENYRIKNYVTCTAQECSLSTLISMLWIPSAVPFKPSTIPTADVYLPDQHL